METDWFSENREYLTASIQYVKKLLFNLSSPANDPSLAPSTVLKEPAWTHRNATPALESICQIFRLSNFEKQILILCVGAEIDGEVSEMCAKVYNNPNNRFPTFDIALRVFPESNWEAILPTSNLRWFQLINVKSQDESPLLTTPIRINERILHFVLGFKSSIEMTLDNMVRHVQITTPLPESARVHVFDILEICRNMDHNSPVSFHLWGHDEHSLLVVAESVSEELGFRLWTVPGDLLAARSLDERSLAGLLSRECFLTGNALYVDAYGMDVTLRKTIERFLKRCFVPLLFIGSREPWLFNTTEKDVHSVQIRRPTRQDQHDIWQKCFERAFEDASTRDLYLAEVDKIVDKYNLESQSIASISKIISLTENKEKGYDPARLYSLLQSFTRRLTTTKLGEMAEEIVPAAKIDDIILPESRKNMIRAIAMHFKHRRKVYEEWGFARKGNRGLGIIALFSGESGTGKTMAAESIANELRADLYRIDLSMIASKYIGETEKNLRQIFDAAESKGSVLFFDEADAVFGKRSEVKDSHDRFANLQVGYLLQRIESFDGVVVLATNFKKSLDPAFMRRIRFVIDFPFPDEKSREEIWRRIFPKRTPTAQLDFKFLARLSITGGSIRNIAINAAFLAAEENRPVSMSHLKQASEEEYQKIGRGLSVAEIGSWP